MQSPFQVEIQRMFVVDEVRGCGLARQTLSALERDATKRAYRRAVLETGRELAAAVRLYEACGYTRIANYPTFTHMPLSICYGKALTEESSKMAKRVDPIPAHLWKPRQIQSVCELCGREGLNLTAHHLIPKAVHRKERFRKWYDRKEMKSRLLLVCRPCHDAIHRCIPDEKELATHYTTRDELLANSCLGRQVEFLRKQKVKGPST